jgi:aminoglycoside/choline kinase family phosphotransferase
VNAELIARTRDVLGLGGDPTLEPLPVAGSDRVYWRVLLPDGSRCVLSRHEGRRAENHNFAPLARLLGQRGLRVPRILAEDEASRLLWMEDLGDNTLEACFARSPEERMSAARAAIEEIARLHSLAFDAPLQALAQAPFDESLYRWEQDYFLEHLGGTHLGLPPETLSRCREHPAMRELAAGLAALPRVPVHRDFQSQNILIQPDGRAALIDFQGLRAGLGEYDLASLFLDPYGGLPPEEADLLFSHYHATRGTDADTSRPIYQACAIQRLMQALGAYGNLGHRLGKPRYLQFIPIALNRLRSVLAGHPAETALAPVFEAAEGK